MQTVSAASSQSTLFDEYAADLEKYPLPDPSRDTRRRWVSVAVLAMLGLLGLTTMGGLIVSGLVFGRSGTAGGECASQSFVLFACLLAIPYTGLHLQAARMNFAVIRSQPVQHPLHSWVVIMARLDLLAWSVALVASAVSLARAKGYKVHVQLDVAICVLSLLAMTLCICVVEKASEPFVLPWISPSRMFVCRISSFRSDFLDDSISRRASLNHKTPSMPAPVQTRSPKLPPPPPPNMSSDDDLPIIPPSRPDHARSRSAPDLDQPAPTYQTSSTQAHRLPYLPHQSPGWKDDWSVFAGEAGLRRSGVSATTCTASSDFSVGTSSTTSVAPQSQSTTKRPPLPPAPYTLWTPFKPAQPRPRHKRSYTSSSPSGRRLLPTVAEIMTPLTESDIDDYLGPWSPASTVRDEPGHVTRTVGNESGHTKSASTGTPVSVGLGITSPGGKNPIRPVGARPMGLGTPKPMTRKWRPVSVESVRDEGEGRRPMGARGMGERRAERGGRGERQVVVEEEREMRIPGSFVE